MKNSLSIRTLLSAITGLLVVMLVLIFAISAKEAFNRKRQAERALSIASITRNTLSAKENIRIEGGVAHAALAAPERASADVIARMLSLRSKTDMALMLMANQLKTQLANGTSPALTEVLQSKARYDTIFLPAVAAVRVPETQRPEKPLEDWRAAADRLTAAVDRLSASLSRDRNDADTFISNMMRISEAVWMVRLDAGSDRGSIGSVIQEGNRLPVAKIQQFAESTGRIDARWADIEEYAAQSGVPPQLQAAISRARKTYLVQFRTVRTKAIADLVAGKPVPVSGYDWRKYRTRA